MTGGRAWIAAVLMLTVAGVLGCVPQYREDGPRTQTPEVDRFFVAADGEKLSYNSWLPNNPGKTYPPKAVIVAVHGFNDYSRAFVAAARVWMGHGIATYAYDQRGFGGNYPRGIWPGREAIVSDVKDFTRAVKARHPGVPVYLLGSSMGGAAVIVALADEDRPAVDGAIVLAPAAIGRDVLPVPYSASLWVGAHTLPWLHVTGRNLERVPSDNIPMLRALSADVSVIKGARLDTLYGLVNLMDEALQAAPRVQGPMLFLYGEKDDIVRPAAALALLDRIPEDARRVGIYENGYHMLLRDLQADVVYEDIVTWVFDRAAPLPSGADRRGLANLEREDGL